MTEPAAELLRTTSALQKAGAGRSVRISPRVVVDIESGKVLYREAYEYSGPVELACGGPSSQQTQAANEQLQLEQEMAGIYAPAAQAESGLVNNLNTAFTTGQAQTETFDQACWKMGCRIFGKRPITFSGIASRRPRLRRN